MPNSSFYFKLRQLSGTQSYYYRKFVIGSYHPSTVTTSYSARSTVWWHDLTSVWCHQSICAQSHTAPVQTWATWHRCDLTCYAQRLTLTGPVAHGYTKYFLFLSSTPVNINTWLRITAMVLRCEKFPPLRVFVSGQLQSLHVLLPTLLPRLRTP